MYASAHSRCSRSALPRTWRAVTSSSSSPACGCGAIDLGQLEADVFLAPRLLARVRREAVPFPDERLQSRERRANGFAILRQPGERIEQIEVRSRIEQHLVLVLAMEIDQVGGQLTQRRGRDQGAVEEGAAATALNRHVAPDHQFRTTGVFEDGLYRGLLLPRPHEIRRRPAADEQSDGADEDRLARAGLAGEHVQARLELDFQAVDHGQIADGDESEHRPEVPSYQMVDRA